MIQAFLDFKVTRYCEGYSFWSKVLKSSRNCSLHNTLIPNLVKPIKYICTSILGLGDFEPLDYVFSYGGIL